MKKVSTKDFCSKMPSFPKKAYIVYHFIRDYENIKLIPMREVFLDIDEIQLSIKNTVENYAKHFSDVEIPPETILVPIIFESNFPLKRKYWKGKHEEFPFGERVHLFLEFLDKPQFHELLVVPTNLNENSNDFDLEAALPFKISADEGEIENFMQNSDYRVNELASHAALYTAGNPARFNYLTKVIDYPERKKSTRDETIN